VPDDEEIDTTNDFLVGVRSDHIAPLFVIGPMDKAKAIRLACWLLVLADPLELEFTKVLEAIKNT
jgi:hypothetical protein